MAIINNNVQNVKFLRNGSVFVSGDNKTAREVALAAMNEQLNNLADGTAILGRYQETNDTVKTLVGFAYVSGETKTLTVFDVEGASADVEALREEINAKLGNGIGSGASETVTAQLTALSGNTFTPGTSSSADTSVEGAKAYAYDLVGTLEYTGVTTGTGVYVTNVTEADGIISATTATLPSATTVSGESKVVIDVTQDKGAITATAANITGVKLAGYAEGTDADIAATDTLGEALGKLQAQINAMDLSAVSGDGKVITMVAEDDGKVSASTTAVKDLQLGGYAKTNDTGDIASADTINVALSKLENKAAAITINDADHSINVTPTTSGTDISVNIKSGDDVLAKDGGNGIYTDIAISAVTGTELTNLGTNVKEAYKLVGLNKNTHLGEYIKIYKDSALVNFYLGHVDDKLTDADASGESTTTDVTYGTGDTALVYIMQLANGKYKLAAVNVESFLQESEFGSGVTADSSTHIVHGVVDGNSEKDESNVAFLTVGADGFKVSGIKDAIDTKINKLDASVTGGTTAGTATSNHIKVVVDEAHGKLTAVTVTETNIADKTKLEELSAKTVTEIASSNASITATATAATDGTVKYDVITDASKIKMSGFTPDASGFTAITQSSSITEAFMAVESYVLDNEQVVSAALNDLNEQISALTSGSTEALNAEIAARKAVDGQDGDTYAANSGKAYISGATSLNDADIKLNDALAALDADVIKQVKVNGSGLTEDNGAVNIVINSAAGTGATNTPITVDTDANGAVTLKLEGLDCGTYN